MLFYNKNLQQKTSKSYIILNSNKATKSFSGYQPPVNIDRTKSNSNVESASQPRVTKIETQEPQTWVKTSHIIMHTCLNKVTK
mgnify:CR=1 FL=1